MAYLLMFILTMFFAYIAQSYKNAYTVKSLKVLKKKFVIFGILSFIPSFFISAFRDYTIGSDTAGTYWGLYLKARYAIRFRDNGFLWINKLAIWLFDNYTGVLIITSLLMCGISFIGIYKNSKYPIMSIVLFFITNVYFISMNMIRQSIATAIFIFALPYINKRCIWKYMTCILVATSIHTSALLFIPVYYLFNIRINKKIIFGSTVLIVFFRSVISQLIENFFMKNMYTAKYFAWYFGSQYDTGKLNLFSLLISACVLVFLLCIYKNAKEDKDYNLFLWLQFISFATLLMSAKLPLAQRVSWMFSFPQYIFLPAMFDFIKNPKLRIFSKIAVYGGYTAYMFATIFIMGYHDVYPYKSIF